MPTLLTSLFRRREPTVRRALDPETGLPFPMKTQTLQGKLTYLGILLSGVGALGNLFGWEIPADEVKGMLSWTQAHWDDLSQFLGLATAAYGRLRLNWRKA